MCDSIIALASNRLELFALELHAEKLRAARLFFWFALAFILGLAGSAIGFGALAYYCWRVFGYPGLIGLSAVALGISIALIARIRRALAAENPPFSDTIAEFQKDRECLRNLQK